VETNLDLADQYTKYVDQPTCSLFCPCPEIAAFDKATFPQATLFGKGRYMGKSSMKDNKYSNFPSSDKINKDNLVMLQFAAKGDTTFPKTYNSYQECFTQVLSKTSTTPPTDQTKAEK
jgi:hypothetical protein